MKRLAIPALLLAAAGSLSACGGGADGAPKDASEGDFCDAQTSILDTEMGSGEELSDEEAVEKIKEWADEMKDVGTPEDMPEDARKGFEVVMQQIDDLPDDAKEEDFNKIEEDLSESDKSDAEAYNKYVSDSCADQMQEKMDEQMDDMMSDMPTEMPSAS